MTQYIRRGELNSSGSNQYLGSGHRGRCRYVPGWASVWRAATSLPGCTCGCDRSGGLGGSRSICFCWSALPPPQQPPRARLRTDRVKVLITSATGGSFTAVSYRLIELIHILLLGVRGRQRKQVSLCLINEAIWSLFLQPIIPLIKCKKKRKKKENG